jgi:hypothetical protein
LIVFSSSAGEAAKVFHGDPSSSVLELGRKARKNLVADNQAAADVSERGIDDVFDPGVPLSYQGVYVFKWLWTNQAGN